MTVLALRALNLDQHAALWQGTEEREVLTDEPDRALLAITVTEVIEAVDRVTTPVRPVPAG